MDPILCFPIDSVTEAVWIGKEGAPVDPHHVEYFEQRKFKFSGDETGN